MSSSPINDAPQEILKTDEPEWNEKMGPIPSGMDVAAAFASGGRLANLKKKMAKAEKALKIARRKFKKAQKKFYQEVEQEKDRHLAQASGHDGESP
jgi:hypothetical protein